MSIKVLNYFIAGIGGYLAILGLIVGLQFTFLSIASHKYWFNYEDITPSKQVFEVGEPLFFISYAEIKHQSHLEWNDV
jgi:hypothetical protein